MKYLRFFSMNRKHGFCTCIFDYTYYEKLFLRQICVYFFLQHSVSATRVNRLIYQQSFCRKKLNHNFVHLKPLAINLPSAVKYGFENCSNIGTRVIRRDKSTPIFSELNCRQRRWNQKKIHGVYLVRHFVYDFSVPFSVSKTFRTRIPR